jgi:hypothetical protein
MLVLPNSEAVLSLLGCNLLSGGKNSADPLRAHCRSARLGSPIIGHHHARSAVMGLYTVRALCTVIRRAALETVLEGGGSGPPWPVEAVRPVMVRPSHAAAPDPLGSPGPRGLPESSPALLGTRRPRTS